MEIMILKGKCLHGFVRTTKAKGKEKANKGKTV